LVFLKGSDISLNHPITTQKVLDTMEKMNLSPATLDDLKTWGIDSDTTMIVIALGTVEKYEQEISVRNVYTGEVEKNIIELEPPKTYARINVHKTNKLLLVLYRQNWSMDTLFWLEIGRNKNE
jgi:hypothetical protein